MRLKGRLLLLMDDLLRVLGRRREDEVMLVLGPRLEDISSAVSTVLSDLEDLLVLLPTMDDDDDDDDDALNEDHLLLSVLSAVDCSRGMYIRRDAWLLYLSSNCKGSIVLR
jgi:hypothetical protein